MPREYRNYHDVHERLAAWRTEILVRMRRESELPLIPSFERQNLAAGTDSVIRVDSFLGTANTSVVEDVYFPVVDPATRHFRLGDLQFTAEDQHHPTLVELRRRFGLHEVAGTGTDLERACRIRDWIKQQFPHFMPYRMPAWNALAILDRGTRGIENYLCIHYTISLVQACLSLGMQARVVNLHRGISDHYVIGDEASSNPPVDEHVVSELWSSETQSWVMLDTDYDCHYERNGRPMSAWEIHSAFVQQALGDVTCVRGPESHAFTAYAEEIEDDGRFFQYELPSYYAHVSVMMRNDFLSDPDGPVPVAHLLDSRTEPIIWHRGSDLRLQPHLMGPVVVATPYSDQASLLADGNFDTGWASSDAPVPHWVEIRLGGERVIGEIALTWPDCGGVYHTSRKIRIESWTGGSWEPVETVLIGTEGPFTKHPIGPIETEAVRIVQEVGDGHESHPNRLWLNQVELLAAGAPTAVSSEFD